MIKRVGSLQETDMKFCPLSDDMDCKECALYCEGEKECAIKVIAMEMIKANEE